MVTVRRESCSKKTCTTSLGCYLLVQLLGLRPKIAAGTEIRFQ